MKIRTDLPPVCRLGLATRGNTHLRRQDVEYAVERGLNYLNWCGKPDGLSRAVSALGPRRRNVIVAAQFKSRTADEAQREFAWILDQLNSDYLDIATFYYVESDAEWAEIIGPGGAFEVLSRYKQAGALKMIGLTSHQRKPAASWAKSTTGPPGPAASSLYHLDMLMIRYNAAHRGAEQDVFPTTRDREMPVVTFTGLRWRALLNSAPDDPKGFHPPSAAECYRFCLANPDVAVALAAPGDRSELEHALSLLDDWRAPARADYEAMLAHGDSIRRHAGVFW